MNQSGHDFVRCLKGLQSGIEYPSGQLMNLDPADGRPVAFQLDIPALAQAYPNRGWLLPERRDLWRYGPLLAPGLDSGLITHGEGWTPLLEDQEKGGGRYRLLVKDEGKPHPGYGANPTGSFKDRGMTMVVNMARRFGLGKLAVPTQGNAGDSLAWLGQKAGIEVAVIMPEDTPEPIMGNVARLAFRYSGIHLELVRGTIREAGLRMKEHWLPQGYFNCATFQEPGWRIEGKKTLGLEIAEQLNWELPDAIIYPTGGGTGILGMHKAFRELLELGAVRGSMPRFYCVQATQTAPLLHAFENEQEDTSAVSAGHTLAVGLNVPGGVGQFAVLDIVRSSGGGVIGRDEDEIASALAREWKRTGLWLCPEGAACYSALDTLVADGAIKDDEKIVLVNTGSFEKYLPSLRHLL